jgi:Rad3-related DNA helicase
MRKDERVDDSKLLAHINELVDEEKQLRAAHRGQGLVGDDRRRLETIERQLDQCWDLLRQRRAREEYGEDPDAATERPATEVEGYLQ